MNAGLRGMGGFLREAAASGWGNIVPKLKLSSTVVLSFWFAAGILLRSLFLLSQALVLTHWEAEHGCSTEPEL